MQHQKKKTNATKIMLVAIANQHYCNNRNKVQYKMQHQKKETNTTKKYYLLQQQKKATATTETAAQCEMQIRKRD
jgi:hypothetical protein